MFGDISLWGDYQLLENLPPSGMTRNGVLFLQPPWEPITDATESSSWPTPTATDYKTNASPAEMRRHSPMLGAMVQMWPTPISHDSKSYVVREYQRKMTSLPEAVWKAMWPTPTTQEVEHPDLELTDTGRRKAKNGGGSHSLGLADAVRLWPTPTASSCGSTGHRQMLDQQIEARSITEEEKKAMSAGNGGRLNPTWVEWLMGFPAGWTDLED